MKNLQEFYNEKNERIRQRALQNLKMIGNLYRIKHNKKIWLLLNKLPNKIEKQYQSRVINLIDQMIYFEKKMGESENTPPKIDDIISQAKRLLIETLLSETADPDARTVVLNILLMFVDKEIIEKYDNIYLLVSHAVPISGSWLYYDLPFPAYPGEPRDDDIIDYEALFKIQLEQKTGVSFEMVEEYIRKTRDLLPETGGFGVLK